MDQYCGHCGISLKAESHEACGARLKLEPPRYCTKCHRRMVVQVIPSQWTARCIEHGETQASTWDTLAAGGAST